MRILKANTAVRLVVGPLCDKTTGLAKPSMTVTNMAMNMWHEHDDGSAPTKSIDAVSFTASGGNNDMVELAGGYYDIEITAAQLNITAGRCGFLIYDDDVILPYFEEWLVVPANVFDSIMGTDKLDVNVAEMASGIITATVIATDAIDADAIKTDAITEIQNGLATPTNITAGTITTVTDVTNAVKISAGTGAGQLDFTSGVVKANLAQILGTALTETSGLIAAAFKKFFNIATPTGTVNSLPDAVPGADGGLPTQNGTKLNQTVDLTAGQSIAANGGTVATVTTLTNAPTCMALEATLTAIKGAGWADETLVTIQAAAESATAPSAADVADAVWNEALSGHTTTGTAGDTLADIDVSGVATAVWAASTRTLTQSAASVTATVSGSDITCTRGDSLSASLTDVGALTGYSKVYFTVKRDHDDVDAVSIIQIEKTAGLKYINGAAAVTSANGTLTIGDEATGDITIALDEVETAKLSAGVYYYDVQIVRSAGTVSTLTSGEFTVSADVTRATT